MKRNGFLAALLGLAAAPALAKVKPEPVFPRFFAHTHGFVLGTVYAEWHSRSELFFVLENGRRFPAVGTDGHGHQIEPNSEFVAWCLRTKRWREITAAEAEALLKPPGKPGREPITITGSATEKGTRWLEFRGDKYRILPMRAYGYIRPAMVGLVEIAFGTSRNWAKQIIDRELVDEPRSDNEYRRLVMTLEMLKANVERNAKRMAATRGRLTTH